MPLTSTYRSTHKHAQWIATYRTNPFEEELNKKRMDRVLRYLGPPPGALFLDAGVGSGTHSIDLARRGFNIIGCDLSETILRIAQDRVAAGNFQKGILLTCQALENLAFSDAAFDFVYCRGVLTHIPQWTEAVENLCRILKPGGRIAILEGNDHSVEAKIVLVVRRLARRESELRRTPGGLEFWTQENEQPFLVRMANLRALTSHLQQNGVHILTRFSVEFLDINRFPSGFARNAVIYINRACFALRLPSYLSSGVAIVGEKTAF